MLLAKKLEMPAEKVIELATNELKKEGFGVLTTIDIKGKLKEKHGINFKKYFILGACNLSNAYKALLVEENIGLMLPRNVIVYEKEGKTAISIIRPLAAMGQIENEEIKEIARNVETQLKKVFDSIA